MTNRPLAQGLVKIIHAPPPTDEYTSSPSTIAYDYYCYVFEGNNGREDDHGFYGYRSCYSYYL